MKNLLLALLILFTVSSCLPEKRGKNDPEPELAGTYNLTRFLANNQEYITSTSGITGSITVTRVNSSRLSMSLSLRGGGQNVTENLGEVDITKASGSNYDILEAGTRIGSINGTDLSLDAGTGADRIVVTARK